MVDPFPRKPYSFGTLRKTFGPLYLRCDLCRRFALLQLGPYNLRDVDSRTKRFSCSVCGTEAWLPSALRSPQSLPRSSNLFGRAIFSIDPIQAGQRFTIRFPLSTARTDRGFCCTFLLHVCRRAPKSESATGSLVL